MNNIKIARRFNNLLEAVTELNVDLSYNREYALRSIKDKSNYRDLAMVLVFCDEANQIWYVIKSLREGLMLLHKYEPFHSCISDAPFKLFAPVKDRETTLLEFADSLHQFGLLPKTDKVRRVLAAADIIAG
jgi:hypothetical protein